MFESVTNRAEFFSDHYLDARLASDLGDLRKAWEVAEGREQPTARVGLRGLGRGFFSARAAASEASGDAFASAMRALNDAVLTALCFEPNRESVSLLRSGGTDELEVEVAAQVETSTGLLLVALDAGLATDVDELFDTDDRDDGRPPAGRLLSSMTRDGGREVIDAVADVPGELFSVDDPPRFVLVLAGTTVLLAERSKWAEGRFLAVDLDAALERADVKAKGELETIAALFSADALVPGRLSEDESAAAFFDEVDDRSARHAVGVSKELREGMRLSVEILANEVIQQRLASNRAVYEGENRVDPADLTRQCLRYLYRLIVLLYAESRPELGVLPTDDDAYLAGYSLDRLRELVLVDLDDDTTRNGTHLDESLRLLFELVDSGYHAEEAQQVLVFDTETPEAELARSSEDYLQFPGLDATIFDPGATWLLDEVPLRNEALQRVLALLMLNREAKKNDQRGFISYAQLGINQLGAVYEGLMAYTGFFAVEDLFEVAKGGDPSDGTWMVPVDQADDYPDDVFVTRTDPLTGRTDRVRHPRGSYVYRLAGRDRQRSASYYTPEVLTSCVVRHALAELLGTDDYAREPGGSAGVTEASEILDLTVCEPALGSGAFLNEAINQLSAEYLKRRQAELGERLDADRYQRELQKVKAHFALHQCYGVDLNATAVELAEVSLWLNCMFPGLKAPWFGLQLRRGNSLIGARRATWKTRQLKDKVWTKDKASNAVPPDDRPLTEPLGDDEIHHFLLPGHGWGAVAGRKEAKELAPDETKALADWRKAILKAPSPKDADRLTALAAGVERLWTEATEVLEALQRRMRRPLDLYGDETDTPAPADDRHTAEQILHNPNSALGRLRLVMDAWVGLWFWPLHTNTTPPTWTEWLDCLEAIIGPEPTEPTGQLDLFADLQTLQAIEEQRAAERPSVTDTLDQRPWHATARDLAQTEGAWHWELEYAPAFKQGGFDLQVGNPPWVRPTWQEDLVLAEWDPWWGVVEKAPEQQRKERRIDDLSTADHIGRYLVELASHNGLNELVASEPLRPVVSGVQTNLYMAFMDTVWRHSSERGAAGMLHPESHFIDPKGGQLRESAYPRLRRHWQLSNHLGLFEEIAAVSYFGIHVYGAPQRPARFLQIASLYLPAQIQGCLDHDGTGEVPGLGLPAGGYDTRSHSDRVTEIDETVLAGWARLFDEPGTSAMCARLLRPVTRHDLGALSVLADQDVQLADRDYHWTGGWHEKGAKADGFIEWDTRVPDTWGEVILQGPHFTVATPFAKEPNENCRSKGDYSDWDLESLPDHVIPRTNYQRACDRKSYEANSAHWEGRPSSDYWRVAWRRMTQPGLERSLQPALLPPGPTHVHTIHTMALSENSATALVAGLWASLPYDYMVKVSGKGDIQDELVRQLPLPADSVFESALVARTARLTCLTAEYEALWGELFEPSWRADRWTVPHFTRVEIGDVDATWDLSTPLRREYERRQALVELDALASLLLGLTADQLCAMYRTQFAVLRKYEYAMAFDAEGRKICAHHHSAGYRQSQLQQDAKDGERDPSWKSIWRLYQQWEEDPDSVDWEDQYAPPFTRPDREIEMTQAYNEFQRRLDAGEYG